MPDVEMPIEAMERAALAAITELLRQGRTLVIAYSGGKDSTTVLLLALKAAKKLREEGVSFPPLLITHGDTGVENPVVVGLVRQELAKARAYGQKHGFEVRTEIAEPSLMDTWAVSILSGRKLPTFANSDSRDCSVSYKIRPMERLRNQILGRRKSGDNQPVTLIGTRFEESGGRAVRMNERGETAYTPWEKDKQLFMSVIADWDMGDVWTYLAQYRDGKKDGFTNAKDIFEMYASAADDKDNTCAVVGDMATEGNKSKRACGARLGCAVCTAVGRDRSLEAMMTRPENNWLRPLNMIQRFLVDTQHDWSRRTWVGRSLNDGYVAIEPDTYSPAMLAELLRYCLSADADEADRAARERRPPGFRLVSDEQMFAIDALWSMNGIQKKPFAALKIWNDVYVEGKRYHPPIIEPVEKTPKPKARYLRVGPTWDSDRPWTFNGFRDLVNEAFGAGPEATRVLKDGRRVAEFEEAPRFSFDQESMFMFFDFEKDDALREAHDANNFGCTEAYFRYVRYGVLATSEGHVSNHVDRCLRRTNWKMRNGLVGDVDLPALFARTVSRAEMLADVASSKGNDPVAAVDADRAATALEQVKQASNRAGAVRKASKADERPSQPAEPLPQLALWDVAIAADLLPSATVRALSAARPTTRHPTKVQSTPVPAAPQMSLFGDTDRDQKPPTWSATRDRFAALVENVALREPALAPDAVEADDHREKPSSAMGRLSR